MSNASLRSTLAIQSFPLYEGFDCVTTLHLEVLCFHICVEVFQVYDWSLTTIFFGYYEHVGIESR